MPTSYPRGTVLKVYFPYDDNPSIPGPQIHYYLFIYSYEFSGKAYAAVCYGTSRSLSDEIVTCIKAPASGWSSKSLCKALESCHHFVVQHFGMDAYLGSQLLGGSEC